MPAADAFELDAGAAVDVLPKLDGNSKDRPGPIGALADELLLIEVTDIKAARQGPGRPVLWPAPLSIPKRRCGFSTAPCASARRALRTPSIGRLRRCPMSRSAPFFDLRYL